MKIKAFRRDKFKLFPSYIYFMNDEMDLIIVLILISIIIVIRILMGNTIFVNRRNLKIIIDFNIMILKLVITIFRY